MVDDGKMLRSGPLQMWVDNEGTRGTIKGTLERVRNLLKPYLRTLAVRYGSLGRLVSREAPKKNGGGSKEAAVSQSIECLSWKTVDGSLKLAEKVQVTGIRSET